MLWAASATIFISSAMLVVMMTTSVLAIAYPYWQALQSERGGSAPHARNLKEKQYVMDWVNHLREGHGVDPVTLGSNPAPQIHAEESLSQCAISHWSLNGLKPYMRYTLGNGVQANAENVYSLNGCRDNFIWSVATDTRNHLDRAMQQLMLSPGHRRVLLDPAFRAVNLGLAWDAHAITLVQHFESDYVRRGGAPTLRDGVLRLTAELQNLPHSAEETRLTLTVSHEPPPRPLTEGQIAHTWCYDLPKPELLIHPPRETHHHRNQLTVQLEARETECPNPYLTHRDTPGPTNALETSRIQRGARKYFVAPYDTFYLTYQEATKWEVNGNAVNIEADISAMTSLLGPGVYTVTLVGQLEEKAQRLSTSSIFHQVPKPPDYAGR